MSSYDEIAHDCQKLRQALSKLGIRFRSGNDLGRTLLVAERLAASYAAGEKSGELSTLIIVAHAQRLVRSMLDAIDDPGALECIKRIVGSQIDSLDRQRSLGKDALWELDLANRLKRQSAKVQHVDPPDLIIDMSFGKYGVACKKIYSEKGVEAQVRKGIKQIEKRSCHGVVAVNIDDLVPADVYLRAQTSAHSSNFLHNFNYEFISRHASKLSKFIGAGACDGIFISTTVFSKIEGNRASYHNQSESVLWALDNISGEQKDRLYAFGSILGK